jgi:hypothetical protein
LRGKEFWLMDLGKARSIKVPQVHRAAGSVQASGAPVT